MEFHPFSHQVAGSFPLLRREDGHLCKPATPNELKFYVYFKNRKPLIAKFVPKFFGKIAVATKSVDETSDKPTKTTQSKSGDYSRNQLEFPEASELPNQRKRKLHEVNHSDKCAHLDGLSERKSSRTWSSKRHKRSNGRHWSYNKLVRKLGEERSVKVIRENSASEDEEPDYVCLVLENLTDSFRWPHVLDLKIGTRQHGSHESEAKKRSKSLKCKMTTSSTLGIRIGGMQTFDDEGRRSYRDKYWGRGLKDDTLKEALLEFVSYPKGFLATSSNHNGQASRRESCGVDIEGAEVVDSDEADVSDLEQKKEEEKLAVQNGVICEPEANYSRTNSQTSTLSNQLVTSRASTSKSTVSKANVKVRKEIVCSIIQQADELIQAVKELNWRFYGCSALITFPGKIRSGEKPEAKLRIIDFANAEMEGHEGYDKGFVFGLENLRNIFAQTLELDKS